MNRAVGTQRTSRRQALVAVATVSTLVWAFSTYRRRAAQNDPSLTAFDVHPEPRGLGALRFSDAQGASQSLAALRGRVVLLNVWATWCPPCREEMPTLDRLQAAMGSSVFRPEQ